MLGDSPDAPRSVDAHDHVETPSGEGIAAAERQSVIDASLVLLDHVHDAADVRVRRIPGDGRQRDARASAGRRQIGLARSAAEPDPEDDARDGETCT